MALWLCTMYLIGMTSRSSHKYSCNCTSLADVASVTDKQTDKLRFKYWCGIYSCVLLCLIHVSLHGFCLLCFPRNFVTVVIPWHKQAVKTSYKKCAFSTCLRIVICLPTLYIYLTTFSPAHVTLISRPCDQAQVFCQFDSHPPIPNPESSDMVALWFFLV